MRPLIAAVVLVVAGTACTTTGDAETTTPPTTAAAPTTTTTTTATTTTSPDGTVTTAPVPPTIDTLPPIHADELPLAVTPAQQEGPYYPVEKLADRDNDLTVIAGNDGTASGNVLVLRGRLVTTDGVPVDGGVVEIWQVDAQGIYLHPDDPGVAERDANFQGYGEATAGPDGAWTFRTIDPGYYEPRPRHIHAKVRIDGDEVLTTQIYFSDDPQAAGLDELLVATVAEGTDSSGNAVRVAEHRIVLDG